MEIGLAALVSLGLLGGLGAASWYLIPKAQEISKTSKLAWSKCCEKQASLELDFHERLNNVYTPPEPGLVSDSRTDIYGGVKGLANHYVEERDRLLSRRQKIAVITRSVNRIRLAQIVNVVSYVILFIVLVIAHSQGFSKWWLYAVVWGVPWVLLSALHARQARLVSGYDEE
jgi:hypothetical protein